MSYTIQQARPGLSAVSAVLERESRSAEGLLRPGLNTGTLSLPAQPVVQSRSQASLVQRKGKDSAFWWEELKSHMEKCSDEVR